MVGQLKEDVAEWYQGLSAHMRIEAMCTLIDLSMPFEIRFLGSLIEHLGRKDFGSLRDAESRANSFANGNPDDRKKLLKSLGEVTPLCLGNGTQYVNPLMQPNSFNDSPANRPSPTHVSDTKGRIPASDSYHGSDTQSDHGLCAEPASNTYEPSGQKGNTKVTSSASNHIGFSSEEETESMCIVNDLKRRKLILYISVLSPTNHDGANLYYTILSDIDDNPALTWLEDLDKDAQEEVSLLYTLASRHPAFTFEQRMFLGTVANRVNEVVGSKFSSRTGSNLQQPPQSHSNPGPQPVYYNHPAYPHAMDPKYGGYYIFAHPPMHIQQSPHQPSSVPNNGEQIRNSTVATPFPAYASFGPYFVPHHPAAISHPTPLNSPYAQNIIASPMPISSSASIVSGSGQNMPQATPVASCPGNTGAQGNNLVGTNVSINSTHQLPSPSGKHQIAHSQPPNSSSTASNSTSQQSCLSTPSRTSSVPFQSEQNSVDGDSAEDSSENCDWNSPESSPYESPPQSLTPSRSQSPPSGVPNSTAVQTVSLSGHGSTFLVTSSGNSIPYGGSVNNTSSSSNSSSSTIVKTEIHNSSGLVTSITTATSCSTTSCLTSTSNTGGGNGSTSSPSNNSNNNPNKTTSSNMPATIHHSQPPPQCHLPHPSATSSVRGPTKNTSSAPSNSNTQSFSNQVPSAVVVSTSSVISVSQQPQALSQSMIGPSVPVHMQQTSTLTSVNNVGGIVSHSMSSNPSLAAAFAQQSHGAHNLSMNTGSHPPPSQNTFPCYPHMNSGVSYGGINAGAYRAQSVLTRNQYIQSHPAVAAANQLLNNQIGMKGPDIQQRGSHHGSLRQKTQLQNTPKRRSNVTSGHLSGMVGGSAPLPNNSQSTSGKGDEMCGDSTKDNRSSEIIVSANPSNSKGSLQQQERTSGGGGGNKPYHHNVSNGIVNTHPGSSAVLPGNPLPNVIPTNNSTGIPNPPPQGSTSSNPGVPMIPTAPTPAKVGEDGLLGDGVAGMDGYAINQMPYHVNGPQVYGHPGGQFIQLPNGGFVASSYFNPVMGAATAMGGPPPPPSTEIMMNPACVPHFSFPFTIPHSFSNLPSTTSNKGNSNTKDKTNSLHGSSSNPSGATDSSNKSLPSNPHENHVNVPASHSSGYYRTPQPSRNNRGVILDIGGGALGNSSLSPVNVDVAAMPPLDDLVETIHRPRKISCYNCGLDTHLGPDCKDGSMEEMTRHQFRVNYSGPSSVTADGKDGD